MHCSNGVALLSGTRDEVEHQGWWQPAEIAKTLGHYFSLITLPMVPRNTTTQDSQKDRIVEGGMGEISRCRELKHLQL